MSLGIWLGVAALGGAGAVARLAVQQAVWRRQGPASPLGTLAVNLSGALALGLVVGLGVGPDALQLVGGGLLGSYTTFSTWMLETQRERPPWAPFALVAVSLAGGLALAGAGWAAGAALR